MNPGRCSPQKAIIRLPVFRAEKLKVKMDISEIQLLRCVDDVLQQTALNSLII
ncbi:hypothetical protein D3C85_1628110 [compost metagenome]